MPVTRVPLTSARLREESALDLSSGVPHPDDTWLAATVPFDLHAVLERAGRLAPVVHGLGVEAAQWVEHEAWWVVIDVPAQPGLAPGERCRLVLEGLDTVVEAWWDGRPLGGHRNMHRPLVADVGDLLRDEPSRVYLRFEAPSRSGDMVGLRKAQFSGGWDFAPQRRGVGVWQPVALVRDEGARLDGVGFRTLSIDPVRVALDVDVDVESPRSAGRLRGSVAGVEFDVAVDGPRTTVELDLDDAALWWTHDLGEPVLHDLRVALVEGDRVLDEAHRRVGVRSVELDRSEDGEGRRFCLVLNGEPLNARGANWVPCDIALGEISPARYDALLTAARDANMQVVRVWGGGIYEPDAFHDACDRLGLLVWQDFMFACADYRDDDPAFVADVLAEARHQVRRLRAHPSTALWCGNNEVELLADALGWSSRSPAHRLFTQDLATVVAEEDGATPYVHGSPCAGNRQDDGDRHAWEMWHGISLDDDPRDGIGWALGRPVVDPSSARARAFVDRAGAHRYRDDRARFVSEWGFAGAPALETLAEVTDPDQLHRGSPQVSARLRHGRLGPGNKTELLLAASVGEPGELADWVAKSRLMQAEALKTGAEHYRRRWPWCGGQLVWQLDDCWPAFSWALVDVAGRRKPAWWAVRRAFAPLLVSFAQHDDRAGLWVTNNGRTDVEDSLEVRLQRFDGTVLQQWEVPVRASRSTSAEVLDVDLSGVDRTACYLVARGAHGTSRELLAAYKDLRRDVPEVRATATGEGVLVEADALALGVRVDGELDDQWFDVHPGEAVLLRGPGAGRVVEVS